MKILAAEGITKTYGDKQLFNHIDFHISEKERVGLIGVNGTGKSSLLKIIAGLEEADSGQFTHPNDYTIGFLSQSPELDGELTVLEQVYKSDATMIKLLRSYEELLMKLDSDPENQLIQNRLFELQKRMDAENAWEASTNAKTILSKLGIEDFGMKIGQLSGGQKKRVALAQVLIETPDLLILDEPTNHLDYETISWLEDFISKYEKSVLLVTHDRYFLDKVTNRIFELDHGRLFLYKGNYQAYIEAKAAREAQEVAAEDKRHNLYRRELAWMKRGAKARSTKQKARIERFEELETSMGNVPVNAQVEISLKGSRLGKQVFEFVSASKTFENKVIFHDFNWLVKPGDRYGIVGHNGSGKSTLLNLLAERSKLDSGELQTGHTVKIAYYTQENEEMDGNQRMIAYIREAGEVVETKDGEALSAAQMLERFLFPMHAHGTLIRKLSGGEKRRLFLLKLLMERPNVLLLDEPTNDLDTATLTVLENYLDDFPGVVISVSHDRYFLDRTASQLLIFQGEGRIERYYGQYSDYLQEQSNRPQISGLKQKQQPKEKPAAAEHTKKKKLSYHEQREWDGIEGEISAAEKEMERLQSELNHAGSDFEKAQQLSDKIDELDRHLEQLIERWTYLSDYVNG